MLVLDHLLYHSQANEHSKNNENYQISGQVKLKVIYQLKVVHRLEIDLEVVLWGALVCLVHGIIRK